MSTHNEADLTSLVKAFEDADRALTSDGGMFATRTEEVFGEKVEVFANRPRALGELLLGSARFGDRLCMAFEDGVELTFDAFRAQVARTVHGLKDAGITKGDRVAICAPNRLEWLLGFWACEAMGAIVVAMNGWWTGAEMANALELTTPKLLIADTKRLDRLGECDVPVIDMDRDFEKLLATDAGELSLEPVDEDDPAMLLFTSGTTGKPKAATLSHRSVIGFVMLQLYIGARGMHLAGIEPAAEPPTRLAVFPLFHVSGMSGTVSAVMTGQTTVWPLGRFDAGRVLGLIKRSHVRFWSGTVTHIARLLDHPDISTVDPADVASIGVGGSASTPGIIARTEEVFPHLRGTFSSGYGSTETGGLVSYASNAMLTCAPDCVGPPLPTIEVRILDDEGQALEDGVEGNIAARSPIVMTGHWNNPEADRDAFLEGRWIKTGDYGRLEGGALFVASRRRDLILRGGENIYPFEIENRIDEHPAVREVAVIGVDHDVLGQEVKAVVVVDDPAAISVDEITAWCAEQLASYKVPEYVEIRTELLPRNPTGKVMKHLLSGESQSIFTEDADA